MAEPIRILHVVSSMNLGGIQTLLMSLYRNIDRNKVQFDFVMHTKEKCFFSDEIEQLGGKIYYVPRFSLKNFSKYIKAWKRFFAEHTRYKVVHGHVRSTAAIFLKIAKRNGVHTIAHSHNTYKEKNINGIIKEAMQFPIRYIADDFFACSKEAANALFGKKVGNKAIVLKNAIDTNKFVFSPSVREDMRIDMKVQDDLVIGTVGRIVEQKNPYFIIDILADCCNEDKSIKFLWVGTGELLESVKKYAEEKGVLNNIVFVGATENVGKYLQAMDVFLMPSLDEGFGIAAIEAEASGILTIVSDHVPPSACITPNTKVLSLDNSSKEWAKFILEHQLYDRTIKAVKYIEAAGYDIKIVSQKLANFYCDILSK